MARRKRNPPRVDESVERDTVTVDECTEAVKTLLGSGAPTVRSANREPTKAELEQRWKLGRES